MRLLCHGDPCRKPRCGFARDPSHNPRSSSRWLAADPDPVTVAVAVSSCGSSTASGRCPSNFLAFHLTCFTCQSRCHKAESFIRQFFFSCLWTRPDANHCKLIAIALVTFARFVSFAYVGGTIPGIQLITQRWFFVNIFSALARDSPGLCS